MMYQNLLHWSAVCASLGMCLGGCAVGPDYKRPEVPSPPSYGWKVASPREASIKDEWWQVFHDPVLNRLEAQATAANPRIQAAVARVDQARAAARVTQSRFFPQASIDPSMNRFHTQKNHVPSELSATATTIPVDFSYEIDLWGKLRRSFEASRAQAAASAADYYQVLLTLRGDVAVNYFLLRQIDAQAEILQRTVKLRQTAVEIVSQRVNGGLAPRLDVDRAETEFALAKTAVIEVQRQRTAVQDTLALLCGQPAPGFCIAPGSLQKNVPGVPVGVPSELLESRPDIAEAERKMAAANAQIGVAKAAFFPAITLTGNAGYSSFNTSTLLNWESSLFQIGPGVTLPIFNGGRLTAGLKEAHANYEAVCANYRQQVLTAFKEVSDSLADLDSYARQAGTEAESVSSAARAATSSTERYTQGLVPYLDVLDAQRTQLQTELQATQTLGLRLMSTVRLIKALGGGFQRSVLSSNSKPREKVG